MPPSDPAELVVAGAKSWTPRPEADARRGPVSHREAAAPRENEPGGQGLNEAGGGFRTQNLTGPPRDWLLWQLADSAFPAGGFAHSAGLEAAFQQRELRNPEELADFIEASLRQLGHASLPFMMSAYDEPEKWLELDRACDNFTTNQVANRASRLQGRALLASAERIFPQGQLQKIHGLARESQAAAHLGPIFGVIIRQLGLAREDAARLFMFYHLRGLISASVRLGLIGPLQGQSVQERLGAVAERILVRCRMISVDAIAQTAPLLELWQANHDRLYSRLFQS